jgi:hypothetical protein
MDSDTKRTWQGEVRRLARLLSQPGVCGWWWQPMVVACEKLVVDLVEFRGIKPTGGLKGDFGVTSANTLPVRGLTASEPNIPVCVYDCANCTNELPKPLQGQYQPTVVFNINDCHKEGFDT